MNLERGSCAVFECLISGFWRFFSEEIVCFGRVLNNYVLRAVELFLCFLSSSAFLYLSSAFMALMALSGVWYVGMWSASSILVMILVSSPPVEHAIVGLP